MKVVVAADDDRILGFTMIGSEAGEVMAAVQTAMLAKLPYPKLRDAVITHLTIAEGLGPLLSAPAALTSRTKREVRHKRRADPARSSRRPPAPASLLLVRMAFETLHPGESFIPAGHVEAICWHLQQVAEGRIRRLLITVPPRHLKSICTSVGFAAWMLGRNPALKILVASYGQDLAAKHSRDFRTVIEAPWCQRLFPKLRPHPKRNTESEFMTTARGLRKGVSLAGAVTGHGADVLIIDDMMKADDARSETERYNWTDDSGDGRKEPLLDVSNTAIFKPKTVLTGAM